MKTLSILYSCNEKLIELIEQNDISRHDELLIRIYTADFTPEKALSVAKAISLLLPNAKIMGCSGSGIIYKRQQYDNETLIMVEKFDNAKISINTYSLQDKSPKQLAAEVNSATNCSTSLMHVLLGDHYTDCHEFLIEFNKLNTNTKLTGGVVGDIITKNISPYIFTPDGLLEHGAITITFDGADLHTYTTANISHEPISPIYTLNKMDGSHFIEVENRPADEWFREHLGLKSFKYYTDWHQAAENDELIKFPIILEGHGGASRMFKYDAKAGKMSLYFSRLSDNTKFRLGYSSPLKCIQECADICNQILNIPIESIFCYTCLFRKMYFENCAEWELTPFADVGICGVFMMGEISYINGKNEFLNGSCSIVGIAEQETYIEPNFSVFEDLYKIKSDNDELLNFVLKKQSSVVTQENKLLMEKLLEQQEKFKDQLFIDANTGIKNAICFSQDNTIQHFNKICMIRVENFDVLFTLLGQHGYYRVIKKLAALFDDFIKSLSIKEHVHFYILNDSTFFIVSNSSVADIVFIDNMTAMFKKLQFVKPDHEEEMLVNRFVITFNDEELLEQGLAALESSKDMQTHFLVSTSSPEYNNALNDETKMLHVLNRVIKAKSVLPYFQGIYDNNKKLISCYEALMRIQDTDGTIYAPQAFMDIAKKYHLYTKLSELMIDKVFDLFSGKHQTVSINLSVHDIKLQEMRTVILNNLQKVGHAKNFTFEILEDAEFRHVDDLKDFIKLVRAYGVKIAIDDFGSGYSNFRKLVMMEPDYIKIDGSIVKDVESSQLNRKVLENIVILGKQMNSILIAEFVENENIQRHVESIGIEFSQGYYFAKPIPYSELAL